MIGLVLDVRLDDAEIQLVGADGVDVVDRPAGGFDRTADAVLASVFVDQAADRPAGGVVDTGDAASADGDELLVLRLRAAGGPDRRGQRRSEEHTSELQSLMRSSYAVFCLKKKKKKKT